MEYNTSGNTLTIHLRDNNDQPTAKFTGTYYYVVTTKSNNA
jgi:hypothetical protein